MRLLPVHPVLFWEHQRCEEPGKGGPEALGAPPFLQGKTQCVSVTSADDSPSPGDSSNAATCDPKETCHCPRDLAGQAEELRTCTLYHVGGWLLWL